jgi:hypothetical protein
VVAYVKIRRDGSSLHHSHLGGESWDNGRLADINRRTMKEWGLWKTVSAFLMVLLYIRTFTTVFNFWKRSLSGSATVSAFLTVSQRFSKKPHLFIYRIHSDIRYTSVFVLVLFFLFFLFF